MTDLRVDLLQRTEKALEGEERRPKWVMERKPVNRLRVQHLLEVPFADVLGEAEEERSRPAPWPSCLARPTHTPTRESPLAGPGQHQQWS